MLNIKVLEGEMDNYLEEKLKEKKLNDLKLLGQLKKVELSKKVIILKLMNIKKHLQKENIGL